jgi:antitoxin (DNA-binding transcriptional repressor) of toxin-antitoxin stability system
MRPVGIKVLKNKLSEYVRLAASGETLLVTNRDRVVAELGPPRPGFNKQDADVRWAEAVRLGHLTPAKDPNAPLPSRRPIMSFGELMRGFRPGSGRSLVTYLDSSVVLTHHIVMAGLVQACPAYAGRSLVESVRKSASAGEGPAIHVFDLER